MPGAAWSTAWDAPSARGMCPHWNRRPSARATGDLRPSVRGCLERHAEDGGFRPSRADLEQQLAPLRTATDDQLLEWFRGMVAPADQAALTGELADYLLACMRHRGRQPGTRIGDLAQRACPRRAARPAGGRAISPSSRGSTRSWTTCSSWRASDQPVSGLFGVTPAVRAQLEPH